MGRDFICRNPKKTQDIKVCMYAKARKLRSREIVNVPWSRVGVWTRGGAAAVPRDSPQGVFVVSRDVYDNGADRRHDVCVCVSVCWAIIIDSSSSRPK